MEHLDIPAEAVKQFYFNPGTFTLLIVLYCLSGVDLMKCLCFGLVSNAAVFRGESGRAIFSIEGLLTWWTMRKHEKFM